MSTIIASCALLLVPLLLAAMGGLIHRASGVVNIGLEGAMLTGAFLGTAAGGASGSATVGFIVAALGAGILTWMMTLVVTRLNANEIIVGLGFNIAVAGVIGFILKWKLGVSGTWRIHGLNNLPTISDGTLTDIPVIGKLLGVINVVFVLAILSVPATAWMLKQTRFGLRLRAAGDAPEAATSLGVGVRRTREIAGFIAGALGGVGGAHLVFGQVGLFNDQMVAGRGFIALAAFFFGRNRPVPTAIACLLFAFFDALQVSLQSSSAVSQLFTTLPYVIVVVALTVTAYQSKLKARKLASA